MPVAWEKEAGDHEPRDPDKSTDWQQKRQLWHKQHQDGDLGKRGEQEPDPRDPAGCEVQNQRRYGDPSDEEPDSNDEPNTSQSVGNVLAQMQQSSGFPRN